MRMRTLLAIAALGLATTWAVTPATAADKGGARGGAVSYDAPMPHSWTGIHAGIQAGATAATTDLAPLGIDGYFYGGRIGADAQLGASPLVVGVFGDFNRTTLDVAGFSTDATSWMVAMRAGVAVGRGGGTLLYGVVGRKEANLSDFDMKLKGIHLGGGLETMVHQNWSIAVEYGRTAYDTMDIVEHTAGARLSYRFPVKALNQ
jgi:opacity protein-like surface antigen